MYKYRTTNVIPWWSRENKNFPSEEIFKKWTSTMIDNNLTINFSDIKSLKLNGKYEDIKYIEQVNVNTGEKRYYYVNNIEKIGGNNAFIYNCILDVYTTYIIDFLNENKNTSFLFKRNFLFEPLTLNYEDNLTENIPILSNQIKVIKSKVNTIEYNNNEYYVINSKLKDTKPYIIEKNKLEFNINKYAIISLKNGYFLIIPIMCNKIIKIPNIVSNNDWVLDYEKVFTSGQGRNYLDNPEWKFEDMKYNSKFILKEVNEINSYKYDKINKPNYKFEIYGKNWNKEWINLNKKISSKPNYVNIGSINGIKFDFTKPIQELHISNKKAYWKGTFDDNFWYRIDNNGTKWIDPNVDSCLWFTKNPKDFFNNDEMYKILFKSYKLNVDNWIIKGEIDINNTFINIINFINKEENINNFIGIFRGPNLFNLNYNFQIDDKYDNLLCCLINGNYQENFNCTFKIDLDFQISNNIKLYNEDRSLPIPLLRKKSFYYYNNEIDLSYLLLNSGVQENGNASVLVDNKLIFSNGFYLISDKITNNQLSYSKNYLWFGSSLPYANDEYKKFIAANKNNSYTSYENQKSMLSLQQNENIFSSVTGLGGIGLGILTGNVGFGLINMFSQTGDLLFSQSKMNQNLLNIEKDIRSKYKTAFNTLSSKIENAGINEIIWDDIQENGNEQNEVFQIRDINNETIKMYNNVFHLNGFINPKIQTLNDFMISQSFFEKPFIYIEMDKNYLDEQIKIKSNYINEIYNEIVNMLSNGIRIWNTDLG